MKKTLLLLASSLLANAFCIAADEQTPLQAAIAKIPAPAIPVLNPAPHFNEFFTPAMEKAVEQLLSQMTVPEKLRMVQGDIEGKGPAGRGTAGIDRLGLRTMTCYNGPRGLQTNRKAILFPCGVGQAATFRPELVEKIGAAISESLLASGWHILEAPSINIIRDPLNGRNFEYFTEDPFLNAKMAAAFIVGGQRTGAINTAKHYLGNNKETNRGEVDAQIDERAMHEIYLPAFKAACDAGVFSIMTGANRVNGPHASDNPMVISVLKRDWNWPGFLYTDWNGVQTAEEAFNAGLDLSMPGKPGSPWAINKLQPLLDKGTINAATLDDKVRRLLRGAYFAGRMPGSPTPAKQAAVDTAAQEKLAYDSALAGMVLVKNDGNLLPIGQQVKKIAVLGPMAEKKFSNESGGSSGVSGVAYEITALEGLKKRFGDRIVSIPFSADGVYALIDGSSVSHTSDDGKKIPGFLATYKGTDPKSSKPVTVKADVDSINVNWEMASPDRNRLANDQFNAKWTGKLVPPVTGKYTFRMQGSQRITLMLDGKVASYKHQTQRNREITLNLVAGKQYDIELSSGKKKGDSKVQLSWITPQTESRLDVAIESSVEAAKKADLAIVLVGLDHNTESEGVDRLTMRLPEYHDTFVQRVLAANPKTVVVAYGGTPLEMDPWFATVPALVLPWISSIENGNALASLLSGDSDFGGRMPITFPKKYDDSPAAPARQKPDKKDIIEHNEGVFVGYRWYDSQKIEPLIPFGHGLSYATFKFGEPKVTTGKQSAHVEVSVKNTSKRSGIEVVQLYVSDPAASVPRPPRELKGFQSVALAAGESKTVSFDLDASAFSFWNPATRAWTLEPGEFEIQLGSSSREILKTVPLKL